MTKCFIHDTITKSKLKEEETEVGPVTFNLEKGLELNISIYLETRS